MPIRLRRPSPALIVALLALFVALGGPAQAQRLINGKKIKRGTVSSKQIRDRGVTMRDLSRGTVRDLRRTPLGSVGTRELDEAAVGAAQLQVGSVTAAALAANSITGVTLADATIGTVDLADGAVTSPKIGNGEVRKVDIATGAVGKAELQSGTVTSDEIADGRLTSKDVGEFSGTVTATPQPAFVPPNGCSVDETDPILPNASGAGLLDDIVLVGRPATLPATLTVSAYPQTEATLTVQVCNPGNTGVSLTGIVQVPFVAIQP